MPSALETISGAPCAAVMARAANSLVRSGAGTRSPPAARWTSPKRQTGRSSSLHPPKRTCQLGNPAGAAGAASSFPDMNHRTHCRSGADRQRTTSSAVTRSSLEPGVTSPAFVHVPPPSSEVQRRCTASSLGQPSPSPQYPATHTETAISRPLSLTAKSKTSASRSSKKVSSRSSRSAPTSSSRTARRTSPTP